MRHFFCGTMLVLVFVGSAWSREGRRPEHHHPVSAVPAVPAVPPVAVSPVSPVPAVPVSPDDLGLNEGQKGMLAQLHQGSEAKLAQLQQEVKARLVDLLNDQQRSMVEQRKNERFDCPWESGVKLEPDIRFMLAGPECLRLTGDQRTRLSQVRKDWECKVTDHLRDLRVQMIGLLNEGQRQRCGW